MVQTDISTITYTVQDLATALTIVTATAITVSTAIFNSLQQQDARWTVDSAISPNPVDRRWGYNFAAVIPAASFASLFSVDFLQQVHPHRAQITVNFTPASGEQFRQAWQVTPIPGW